MLDLYLIRCLLRSDDPRWGSDKWHATMQMNALSLALPSLSRSYALSHVVHGFLRFLILVYVPTSWNIEKCGGFLLLGSRWTLLIYLLGFYLLLGLLFLTGHFRSGRRRTSHFESKQLPMCEAD